jgi:hypothetical protein
VLVLVLVVLDVGCDHLPGFRWLVLLVTGLGADAA